MSVELFFYAPDEDTARALAGGCQTTGLVVEAVRPAAEGPEWLVLAVGSDDFDPDAMAALAASHGAEFDGWGQYVGPLDGLAPRQSWWQSLVGRFVR